MIDIDSGIKKRLLKFADDIKLFRNVSSSIDISTIEDDLKIIQDWSETWQMKFNIDKCKVIHFGSRNTSGKCLLNGEVIKTVEEERDLGILVHKNFKVYNQSMLKGSKISK